VNYDETKYTLIGLKEAMSNQDGTFTDPISGVKKVALNVVEHEEEGLLIAETPEAPWTWTIHTKDGVEHNQYPYNAMLYVYKEKGVLLVKEKHDYPKLPEANECKDHSIEIVDAFGLDQVKEIFVEL